MTKSKASSSSGKEPQRRGHRQKGAGTVTTSKGDRVVSGVLVKEWQKTPKKLLQEMCQQLHRPKPFFRLLPKSSSCLLKCRVTLEDPKKAALSLSFLTQEEFATQEEAEHATSLLALHHLGPELPRERVLPEPYRSMWLQLVGESSSSVPPSSSKKDKKKSSVAEEPKKASDTSHDDSENKKEAEISARKTTRSGVVDSKDGNNSSVSRKAVVDPTAVVPISSSLRYVSQQERQQVQLKKKETMAKKSQARQVKEMTNPDVVCFMEEKYRLLVERLLRDSATERKRSLKDSSTSSDHNSSLFECRWPSIQQDLLASGFADHHMERVQSECLALELFTTEQCIDWLCLHLPEEQLPAHLTARGKHMEIYKSNKETSSNRENSRIDETLSEMETFLFGNGFEVAEVRHAMQCCGHEVATALHCLASAGAEAHPQVHGDRLLKALESRRHYSPDPAEDAEGSPDDLRAEEKEVLTAMFDDSFVARKGLSEQFEVWSVGIEVEVPTSIVRSLLSSAFTGAAEDVIQFKIVLDMHLCTADVTASYPFIPPVVLIRNAECDTDSCTDGHSLFCSRQVRRALHQALAHLVRSDELRGGPVLHACSLWLQDGASSQNASDENSLIGVLTRLALGQNEAPTASPTSTQCSTVASNNTKGGPLKNSTKRQGSGKPLSKNNSQTVSLLSPTERNDLSASLYEKWEHKRKNRTSKAEKIHQLRSKLPAASYKKRLLEAIADNQVVLVCGETGCGKTTQVPQYILEDFISLRKGGDVKIICTQPRRLAAIGVSERVVVEQDSTLGDTIGYQVRMDSRKTKFTRLIYCTTGILLRQMHSDPDLNDVTHLIIDEVHERDVDTDFLLALLKPILQKRQELKLILMSATMDASKFVGYFEDIRPPVINIPGFVFPVEEHYLDELDAIFSAPKTNFSAFDKPVDEDEDADSASDDLNEDISKTSEQVEGFKQEERKTNYEQKYSGHRLYPLVAKTVLHADRLGADAGDDGAVLVFMSGSQEIHRAISAMQDLFSRLRRLDDFWILPLHGALTAAEQSRVFQRPPSGRRKVVVSTNVAETSITMDDCVFVVDSGKMKQMQFEAESRVSSLREVNLSLANARQRLGRAGRVRPGHCFRLYTRQQMAVWPPHPTPEIHRVPLERLCLLVRSLDVGRPKPFLRQLMESPAEKDISAALCHLRALGAFDESNDLTPLGAHLARLPVDAQVGKLLVFGAALRCLEAMLVIAAALSVSSPFKRDEAARQSRERLARRSMSDHLAVVVAVQGWREAQRGGGHQGRQYCRDMGLSEDCLKQIGDIQKELRMALSEAGFVSKRGDPNGKSSLTSESGDVENAEVVKAVLCAGLYPHLARVHFPHKEYEELAGGAFEKGVAANRIKFFVKRDKSEPKCEQIDDPETETESEEKQSQRVFLHPSSGLFHQNSLSYRVPWLVFSSKVQTSKVFLRDVTMVPPYALLLFGGRGNLRIMHDKGKLVLDDWVHFTAPARIGVLVRELRRELEAVLQAKIETPSLDISSSPVIEAILLLLRTNGLS